MADGYTLLVDGFSNIAANVGLFMQLIAGAALAQATGTRMLHVPYRGAQAAYQDLLSGRIDLFFDNAGTAKQYVDSALVKAFAVSTAERNDPPSGYFGRIRDVIG